MDYRREIDGLRALAVIPVILFHAGFESFGGGFVGVDVFFVISGYLITSIILAELEQGKFSIVNFYERRARRILPALSLVMLLSIPFAWFWLLPREMKDFSQSLVAVSLFSSNILFWQESGYFDTAAELKPLLHTWSLAVEEQYYVIFPIILMLAWRLGKRGLLILLAIAFVASLLAAQWWARADPTTAFYLLPARGWELLMGAFAAFYLSRGPRKEFDRALSEWAGWLGVALILYAVFAYTEATPFPGFYALVPTLGTVLIILFATQQTIVGRFVGNKVFVGVGLISYSAYLWHQPLFAFAKSQSLYDVRPEPDKTIFLMLALASLILAYFSWKYVEVPFRCKTRFTRKKIFIYSVLAGSTFIALGFLGIRHEGFDERLPGNLVYQSLGEKVNKNGDVCKLKASADYAGLRICEFGDLTASRSVILYGDSHAQAMSWQVHEALLKNKAKGLRVEISDCEVVPRIHDTSDQANLYRDCTGRFQTLLKLIRDTGGSVIVVSRWSIKLYPVEEGIMDMPSRNSEGGHELDYAYREYVVLGKDGKLHRDAAAKERAVRDLVDGLLSVGVKVFVVYPIPEIAWDITRVNYKYFRENGVLLPDISIPHSDYISRHKFVKRIFDSYVDEDNFHPVRPELVFCDSFIEGRCVAQFNTVPFYYDDDHLSDVGARMVMDVFVDKLGLAGPAMK